MSRLNRTEAYLVLNLLPQMGPRRLARLLEAFGAPEEALAASPAQLARVPGISMQLATRIAGWEKIVNPLEELRLARELGAEIVARDDPFYPPLLREIYDPPILLYTLGRLTERERHCVGIVGSRNITHYGQECSRRFGYSLAKAGLTVVSGLAMGVDTEAHKAALAAGGRTVGVIGSGLGHIYPPENRELARKIAENGAVISEFPIRQRPDRTTFPMRNRVISGMSEGILVVEAGERSGALITASQAVEQNRAVFAVPGPIDAGTSLGCNRLIQEGARLVVEPAEVLGDLANLLDMEGKPSTTLRKVPGYPTARRSSRTAAAHAALPTLQRQEAAPPPVPMEFFEETELELNSAPATVVPVPAYVNPPEAATAGKRRALAAAPAQVSGATDRHMPPLEPREALLLGMLGHEPVGTDDLVERSGLVGAQLSAALMSLEMKHLAKQLPGRMYVRA